MPSLLRIEDSYVPSVAGSLTTLMKLRRGGRHKRMLNMKVDPAMSMKTQETTTNCPLNLPENYMKLQINT